MTFAGREEHAVSPCVSVGKHSPMLKPLVLTRSVTLICLDDGSATTKPGGRKRGGKRLQGKV